MQMVQIKRHAHAIMPQDLDQIALTAPEAEDLARMGIAAETLLHLQRQRVHAPSLMCCST